MTPLTPLVGSVVVRDFLVADRAMVSELLQEHCGAQLPLVRTAEAIERIRLAVLKLAAGRADALLDHIAMAQRDWRDVLVAAGFGSDPEAHRRWAQREAP